MNDYLNPNGYQQEKFIKENCLSDEKVESKLKYKIMDIKKEHVKTCSFFAEITQIR
jgi:hypothetical protein